MNHTQSSCFLILFSVFLSLSGWSQKVDPLENVKTEIKNNQNYLYNHAVFFTNGYIPYTENGKWGIKNPNGEFFLPVIYDSLFHVGETRFITVKGSNYQLLDFELQSQLDSSVVSIYWKGNELIAIDKTKNTSRYSISSSNALIPTGSLNHLNKQVKPDFGLPLVPVKRPVFINKDTFIVDSIQISWKSGEQKELIFFKAGKEYWRRSYDFKEYTLHGDRFFRYSTEENGTTWNHLFDLNTLKPVFSVKASTLEYFENDNKDCFLVTGFYSDQKLTKIFDADGSLLSELAGIYTVKHRLLMTKVNHSLNNVYSDRFNLLSFPDLKKIETNVVIQYPGADSKIPFLVIDPDKKTYKLYVNSKPVYQLKHDERVYISSTGIHPETGEGLIVLALNKQHNVLEKCLLISTSGKVLGESKLPITCVFNEQFNQVNIRIYDDSRKIDKQYPEIGIYLPKEDKIQMIPFLYTYWTQISTNTILYRDKYYNEKTGRVSISSYFLHLDGSCINDEVYTEAKVSTAKNIPIIQLRQNGTPAIFNNQLEQYCKSCFFEGLGTNVESLNHHFVINRSLSETKLEVVDENLKRILPDEYLAVHYNGYYYVVLTKEHKIVYFQNPVK